jgi:hypothetical protein
MKYGIFSTFLKMHFRILKIICLFFVLEFTHGKFLNPIHRIYAIYDRVAPSIKVILVNKY